MDHYSIVDRMSPAAIPPTSAFTSSVSAGIAAANRNLPLPQAGEVRPPAEDSAHSLAAMAERDLDAALQLLADRAQYITGASGAAIALRRGDHNDMLCRASAGSTAPELGTLLSMQYGLSGECVRTGQLLRCDDTQQDPRVNHDLCRELGIASVVVVPIVNGEQVLGVFELLSGSPRAFGERDLSALLRLSMMVETSVKHAVVRQSVAPAPAADVAQSQAMPQAPAATEPVVNLPRPPEPDAVAAGSDQASASQLPQATPQEQEAPLLVPKKPLFWSAVERSQEAAEPKPHSETVSVPLVLRNLRKCQACGFPISQSRTFCVECEEKQWRGQRLPDSPSTQQNKSSAPPAHSTEVAAADDSGAASVRSASPSHVPVSSNTAQPVETTIPVSSSENSIAVSADSAQHIEGAPESSAPFLSSALQTESWFASNKYILGSLLIVAVVIAAIAWLR
jgi:hypothetical protein